MTYRAIAYPFVAAAVLAGVVFVWQQRYHPRPASMPVAANPNPGLYLSAAGAATSSEPDVTPRKIESDFVQLDVPFVSESPEESWKGPWINGCEEASIAMVEFFYRGQTEVAPSEAVPYMQKLFTYEDKVFGSNANTDAADTVKLINQATGFRASLKESPSIEDIKHELQAGRPIISLHYGKTLNNPGIPFARNGSYYHMVTVIGYDEKAKEFIVNDDGDRKDGPAHRYGYDTFMTSLHDYVYATKRTEGPARVIFTSSAISLGD